VAVFPAGIVLLQIKELVNGCSQIKLGIPVHGDRLLEGAGGF
jgi:hypothetical protein